MSFNLSEILAERDGENFQLQSKYMNPQLAKVVKTLGFDRFYVRGEGCYLYDDEGAKYLDLLSGFGVFALGRSHPVVRDALHQALDADLPNMVQMDCALLPGLLAEQLVTRSPDQIERVYFCNSGAEAVEAAIKFARASTGRQRIAYHAHAYHGLTMGALALNGSKEFKKPFGDMLPGAVEIPFGDVDALRAELRRGDVAAFIVEPIQGKGVYELEGDAWRSLEAACRESGTSSSVTKCRLASVERASSTPSSTSAYGPTSSPSPRRCREGTSRWARCSPATRSFAASTARWIVQWCTRPPSRAISWPWWRVSRRCRSSTTTESSITRRRWGTSGTRSSANSTSATSTCTRFAVAAR